MNLGQHFLINRKVVKEIVKSLDLTEEDIVLEIGPGKGVLSEEIKERVAELYLVEIDKNLCRYLEKKFGKYENVKIINLDFLKFDFSIFSDKKIKIVGNIPYRITLKILMKVFSYSYLWKCCVFMVQKEVAQKLLAVVGDRFFCKLTLIANFYSSLEKICNVSKTDFVPQPNVFSTIVKFLPKIDALEFKYKESFFNILDAVFRHRRKTILNCLSMEFNFDKKVLSKILMNLNIKSEKRPEQVDLEQYLNLAENIVRIIKIPQNFGIIHKVIHR
ncbi:MAG: 16S rRNA (adenine(1518)-N(6)/adenine(1519)-N(6))-dimethyltransferase RsmA [Endomicrobia bacterium]|nr:16S rRNA (adenine(1518)-N(6)/adenine(1519)-N(6))-dimethyltransferase RsmA [Endomicrobiia bacterium]